MAASSCTLFTDMKSESCLGFHADSMRLFFPSSLPPSFVSSSLLILRPFTDASLLFIDESHSFTLQERNPSPFCFILSPFWPSILQTNKAQFSVISRQEDGKSATSIHPERERERGTEEAARLLDLYTRTPECKCD